MIRILNAEPDKYCESAREILRSIGELHEINCSREELLRALPDYDVLIVRLGYTVDQQLLDVGRRLKYIVTATTGLDHIDLAHAAGKGITVLSLRGQTDFLNSVRATAELTVGILLALLRNIPLATTSVKNGLWDRDIFTGFELYGKTAGIIGMGRLGTIVAGYLAAFGMKVLGYDVRPDFPEGQAERMESLGALLSRSDILSLHVSYNDQTRHLIGPQEFAAMKRGAYLVNTSRGGIIDEGALLEALQSGKLAGAALDVLDGEPRISRVHPLIAYAREYANLLLVPHIGGNTFESFEKTEVFMAKELQRAVAEMRSA